MSRRAALLFLGTAGNRFGELATLTADRVDLKARTIFIPAELCKEGADTWIGLTAEEVTLLREQLVGRAARTPLMFPGGRPVAAEPLPRARLEEVHRAGSARLA